MAGRCGFACGGHAPAHFVQTADGAIPSGYGLPFSSADCLTPSRLLDGQSFAVASARYYFWNVSEPSPRHE
jgi:hypothetical protein